GDVVRVGNEITPRAAQSTTTDEHIVIIGGGAAGAFAARELRRLGFGGRVTIVSRDERLPYDRPNLSKDYLAGKAPQEWLPLLARVSSDSKSLRHYASSASTSLSWEWKSVHSKEFLAAKLAISSAASTNNTASASASGASRSKFNRARCVSTTAARKSATSSS